MYERALREGQVTAGECVEAPCLVDHGLLQPAAADVRLLVPTAPTAVLHRLLRASGERIAQERRREERLTRMFEPLLKAVALSGAAVDAPGVTVLRDKERIGRTIAEAMTDATEVLTIQPRTSHIGPSPHFHAEAMDRDQALLDRGGRIRALYQHTLRHAPTVVARYEQLRGDVEARTLDEVPERLIVIDRAVAYVPADTDRNLALEMRIPALVTYLVIVFDRLWHLATPMHPKPARRPAPDGITPRQHAIAALLVQGHTDAVIAERLGMNVRTAREHIAKLAATLGSGNRAQLGYLIAQSGILKQEP
nr:helix-turn-helix transcriptional regulator [Streptomyces sp. SID8381]